MLLTEAGHASRRLRWPAVDHAFVPPFPDSPTFKLTHSPSPLHCSREDRGGTVEAWVAGRVEWMGLRGSVL